MQKSSLRLSLASIALSAAMAPAFAGNYAEGDPRPVALTSSTSRTAVEAATRAWMPTAPSAGYTQGDPRPVARSSQLSRAVVQAETMDWVKSGLAAMSYGDRSVDPSSPAYVRAARKFASSRNASQDAQTSQAPATSATTVR